MPSARTAAWLTPASAGDYEDAPSGVGSAGGDDAEGLGEPALRQSAGAGRLAGPLAQPAVKVFHVLGLAAVLAQCCDLVLEGVGDVDVSIRLCADQPDLADVVWLVALVEQFRERTRIARIGVHGGQRSSGSRQVVRVGDVDVVPVGDRGLAQHSIGTDDPDHPRDVTPQAEIGHDHAVGMAEPVQLAHTHVRCRRGLLGLPHRRQLFGRVGHVVVASLPACRQAVRHVASG